MRVGLFVVVAAGSAVLALGAACASFSSGAASAASPEEAGSDAPVVVESCANGPKLVDGASAQPDASCGPNGAVVDLSSNDHCGACGHGCGAGTCASGMCTPESLLSGESVSVASVVGAKVYFARTNHEVARAELVATMGETYRSGTLPNALVRRVQVAGTWLYVSTALGASRVALDDTLQEPVPPSSLDLGGVVAAEPNGYFYASKNGVERHTTSGTLTSVNSPGTMNVVSDGDKAYWATSSDAGAALHGPFPLAEPPLTAAAASAVAMAVDATHVYFADSSARLIRRIARAGGSLQSVSSETSQTIGDLAVDRDYVYWTADRGSKDGWVVMRVGKCGGLPLMLAKDLPALTQLSFDGTYVYTVKVSTSRGDLIRVAK